MKFSAVFPRKVFAFSFLLLSVSAFLLWHFSPRAESAAPPPEKPGEIQNYDIRTAESLPARAAIAEFLSAAGTTEARGSRLA